MTPLHEMYKVAESGCWIWQLAIDPNGYGHLDRGGHHLGAHRWMYTQLRGPIPDGLQIDHLCRVKACVNPDHLEPVTQYENWWRGSSPAAENARRTHCKAGHLLDAKNTRFSYRANGHLRRTCRSCMVRWQQEYQVRKTAAA